MFWKNVVHLRLFRWIDDAELVGCHDGFDRGVHAEFREDVPLVGADGMLAPALEFRDVLHFQSLGEQGEDHAFGRGEYRGVAALVVKPDELPEAFVADELFILGGHSQSGTDFLPARRLVDETEIRMVLH